MELHRDVPVINVKAIADACLTRCLHHGAGLIDWIRLYAITRVVPRYTNRP
ncbi:hypothetical protein [Paenibacillus sp.]|uniref:hypothetical protein n=1 Tax=Paenibacillus sp. TaxID=58172 RepID=UPI0034644142